ncbi:hypothetical protein INF37_12120 [Pseudoflavonifractor sp. DSM 107456]|uniref:Ig-like domain-containing protein n=2 Tax=Pseudoflavonifractor TaxID=1017280 RepID=A0ABR9RDF8_9FIRM|nr:MULTISPECIES: hypothetical protein [Eubacteriales]MBC5730689.1 hypothetical protein [Pseudoflavonifractor hominis]MBE5056732.1 hypothetical protein [Pseudoflavonifractor gallinarum]
MRRRILWLRAYWPLLASLLFLVFSLLFLWACTGFAMPTQELALVRLEQQAILPRGTTVARGSVRMEHAFPADDPPSSFTWVLRQYEDGYRLFKLQHFLGLWRDTSTPWLDTNFPLSEPLCLTILENSMYNESLGWKDGMPDWTWYSEICALAFTTDPAVERVEATVGWRGGAQNGDHLTTLSLTETAPDSGIWLLQTDVSMPDSGSLSYTCRAYDAAGTLLCTYSNED